MQNYLLSKKIYEPRPNGGPTTWSKKNIKIYIGLMKLNYWIKKL